MMTGVTTLALHAVHAARGARFGELAGMECVTDHGDPGAEYRAFRESAGVIDLSFRGRLVLLGADRAKLLNGQVTQDIKKLSTGEGAYAALVNAKARMLADVNVLALAAELLLDLEPGLVVPVKERLEKFIIAEDVQVVDASALYGHLGIQGPRAPGVIEALGWFPEIPSGELEHRCVSHPEFGELYLARHGRLGGAGFDLFVPVQAMSTVEEALTREAIARGGRPAGWTAFETARVEAGIPRYGADMDDALLPPECGIADRAISYAKGCYSGQEVIARIRTYGQVAKALRGLDLGSTWEGELPARGTKLFRAGKDAGFLTSVVRSPHLGRVIALGYVRRECNGPGNELAVGHAEAAARATVVALPFVGPQLAAV